MSLGSKLDYLYINNLRFSKAYNLLKNIIFHNSGRLHYFPRRYSIEPTTICNLKCPYCFHWKHDEDIYLKKESLSFENFKIIFDKIKKYALLVEFYNFGEPFLNRETPKMIATATKAGIRSRISTNMNAKITDNYAREIVDSGLYRLTCSIDGHTQEVYEKYRVGGNLAVVLENADRVLYYKKKLGSKYPIVAFRMLLFEWNYRFAEETRKLAQSHCFDEFHVFPGSFDIEDKKVIWSTKKNNWQEKAPKFLPHIPEKAKVPCEWLFNGMIVNANGNVIPCCYGNTKKGEHLSLLTHSLEEVWNSPAYVNSRLYTLGLIKDRNSVLPLCKHCRLL